MANESLSIHARYPSAFARHLSRASLARHPRSPAPAALVPARSALVPALLLPISRTPLLLPHQIAAKVCLPRHQIEAPRSILRAAVVAMSRPPRPRGASTAGLRQVGSGSSPGREFPLGFEDADARRGDGPEVGDDMSHDRASPATPLRAIHSAAAAPHEVRSAAFSTLGCHRASPATPLRAIRSAAVVRPRRRDLLGRSRTSPATPLRLLLEALHRCVRVTSSARITSGS
ncbi:hypothetical protein C2845_PM06G28320 [Panicum miliaceum]|uniref:Uncharacterized protein n=1 Tax=Panicum miliaceum TaxID=4540 RepID=A0A3L6RBR8_PANMI|nr:hypothetical protein C2845_PM06G28320 [Panicum miliaceum]